MATLGHPGAPYLDWWFGRRSSSRHDRQVSRILYSGILLLMLASNRVSSYDDRCDSVVWDQSGESPGVRDVHGQCTAGEILWRNPYGAIRLTLELRPVRVQRHPVSVAFEACFTATARDTAIKLFRDDVTSPSLEPLVALNSSQTSMPRELCFVSHGGEPVVIYMEAEMDAHSAAFGSVHVDYDNRRLPVASETRDMDDCRPCTDEELIDSVCSSDFALIGSMNQVTHNVDLDETNLHISVKQVFRQRQDVFKDRRLLLQRSRTRKFPKLNIHTENGVREWPQDTDSDTSLAESLSKQSGHDTTHDEQDDGVIFAPHQCGIRKGRGDFVFIGRIRLKRALLQCAPRLDDFNRVWKDAIVMEKNMCTLR